MSALDDMKNKAEELAGKARDKIDDMTGDKSTQLDGKTDQAESNVKQAGENVKDTFTN